MACATKHYDWVPKVSRVVELTLSRYPRLSANTYVDHPWEGWDAFSVDFWAAAGCGVPAPWSVLNHARAYLFDMSGPPLIRHTILGHTLWTSFGGFSYWAAKDHSGKERHLHVTYWP